MEVKERILEKARELFFKFGMRSVTMDEIARGIGISKKTLYEVFPAKKDIINEFTRIYLENQQEMYKQMRATAHDPLEEQIKILEKVYEMFEKLDVRVVYELQRFFPEAWQIFLDHKEEILLRDLVDNLNRGIKMGLYRKDIDVDIISRVRLEQAPMAFDASVFPPEKYSITYVHQQLLIQYLHGICTAKGRDLLTTYLKQED